MKVVTPEGYTFVTKFQEDNSHKVLRSVDFFSIKFDEIFFDTVCWVIINGLKEEDTKKFDERMKVEVEKVELLITDGMNITLPKIGKVYRLGKYSIEKKSPRPMRVVFKEKIEKDRVLRNAPNLKTADDVYRTCYVNKDMNSDEKKEFEEKMKEAKDLNLQEGNEKKFFVVRGYPTKWKIVEKVRSTK